MLEFVRRKIARPGRRTWPPTPIERNAIRDKRPSIGLALGGGAARGFAHIGVLRTLQKHGIEAQIIAGTSIGAVAGGLLCGRTARYI